MEQQPATTDRVMRLQHKRRRVTSAEAEIRRKAEQIIVEREADAYKAAALMICSRKLDEIRDILRSAGLGPNMATPVLRAVVEPPQAVASTIQHPCTYCGIESVYRTKPNKFNRTGTWLCRGHLGYRRQHEQDGAARPQLVEPAATVDEDVVVNGGPPLAPEKKDTGGDVSLEGAMAALGVTQ